MGQPAAGRAWPGGHLLLKPAAGRSQRPPLIPPVLAESFEVPQLFIAHLQDSRHYFILLLARCGGSCWWPRCWQKHIKAGEADSGILPSCESLGSSGLPYSHLTLDKLKVKLQQLVRLRHCCTCGISDPAQL